MASQMAATFMKFGRAPTTEMILKAIAYLTFLLLLASGKRQHVRCRARGKIIEEARELRFRSSQIVIMTELRTPPRRDTGLLGIDLPGMQIDHCRLLFLGVDTANSPRRQLIRQKPKITAAGDRKIDAARDKCRRRKLQNAPTVA